MKIEFDTEDLKDSGTYRALMALMKQFDVEYTEDSSLQSQPHEEEKPKTRRGRKPKNEAPPTAVELHQALKQMDADTRPEIPETLKQTDAPTEPQEEVVVPEDDGLTHDDLVKAVRDIMFARGHVWMRNVLEKHKKQAKTMAEMPDEVLRVVLSNPDVYDEVV